VRTINKDSFWIKVFRQRLIIEDFAGLIEKLYITGMTTCKQTVFIFTNTSAEYATLPAMLKPLCTRRKPPNPNQIIFFCDEAKILTRMERQTERMTDNVF
jgi:hypothetical protein